MNLVITKYSELTRTSLVRDGHLVLQSEENDAGEYFKEIYKKLNCGYPKFYKMDSLSKLGFLAAENLLLDYPAFTEYSPEDIAIVVQNYSSSLDTDIKHQESIADRENYFPSPAVFVYTLPNIMLGEMCIRHKIKGENACFLASEFQPSFVETYLRTLFENEGIQCCITGWLDYFENNFRANLFLVEKETAVDAYIAKFDERFLETMIKNNGRID